MHEVTQKLLGPSADIVVYSALEWTGRTKQSMVLDEQVWGNRMRSDQSPWFIFLEFLSAAEYFWRHNSKRLFDPVSGTLEQPDFHYSPHVRLELRVLLFNEQDAQKLANGTRDNESTWNEWLKKMQRRDAGPLPRNFSYLKDSACFSKFDDFARALTLLRSADVGEDGKRWTSRFLFPFGKHALYEDVGFKRGKVDRNYIYFGHTGELLYMMVCRSRYRDELAELFSAFFERQDPFDDLVKVLLPSGTNGHSARGGGYLPFSRHDVYDELCVDWLNVLKLNGMSWQDRLPHLACLGALHLMRYQLIVSSDVLRIPGKPAMVCEIPSPRPTLLRRLSIQSLETNKSLSTKAVAAYLNAIANSNQWQRALADEDAMSACRTLLRDIVGWQVEDVYKSPAALLQGLREAALTRHAQRSAGLQVRYGRSVGLISKRGTNRNRYAPSDALLRTLVLANVSPHMEFSEFLKKLWKRYGLIVGQKEAGRVLDQQVFDAKTFQENASRLEHRLGSLGLVRRLSDACAYVVNPYSPKERQGTKSPAAEMQ